MRIVIGLLKKFLFLPFPNISTIFKILHHLYQEIFPGLLLSEGEKICSEAFDSQGSGSLLVPHPTDCTKFYNCQPLTTGRYIAHEQSCPPTTGFDATLQICNFIGKLPRCRKKKLFWYSGYFWWRFISNSWWRKLWFLL